MINDYFKKHSNDKPEIKCANFYFLLYISKAIDIETAKTYARQIYQGKIDWDILKEILGL